MKPSKLVIWFRASRPRTLPAAWVPIILGMLLAWEAGQIRPVLAIFTFLAATLIQLGTNYANDYYDFIKGADTSARQGEKRATQSGWVKPRTMRSAFILAFLAASVTAVPLLLEGGWPILCIGVLGILFGILYTGGPAPLGYLGLGDVFVLIFFGPVAVAGTTYLQISKWLPEAVVLGLAPGLLSTAILAVNNLRDRKTDVLVGKKTLPVRLGRIFGIAEYCVCVCAALLLPVAYGLSTGRYWWCTPVLLAPWGFSLIVRVAKHDEAELDPLLGETGKLLVAFGVVLLISRSVATWMGPV